MAKTGTWELLLPTATNTPEEFTVTENIAATVAELFIRAGVVHVEPFEEVA